jgi:hypothetical protein
MNHVLNNFFIKSPILAIFVIIQYMNIKIIKPNEEEERRRVEN